MQLVCVQLERVLPGCVLPVCAAGSCASGVYAEGACASRVCSACVCSWYVCCGCVCSCCVCSRCVQPVRAAEQYPVHRARVLWSHKRCQVSPTNVQDFAAFINL